MMKVVKLTPRNVLYGQGYTHAIKFNPYNTVKVHAIINYLSTISGEYKAWRTMWGAESKKTRRRTYWIAFKDEEMLTMTLLASGG